MGGDEVKGAFETEGDDAAGAEEGVDVADVAPEEVEGVGVVVLDGLGDVDDVRRLVVVAVAGRLVSGCRLGLCADAQDVVLAQIGVDELAAVVEEAKDVEHLVVERFDAVVGDVGVLQPRRSPMRGAQAHEGW